MEFYPLSTLNANIIFTSDLLSCWFFFVFGWSLCSLRWNLLLFWPLHMGFTLGSSLFLALVVSFTLCPMAVILGVTSPVPVFLCVVTADPISDLDIVPVSQTQYPTQDSTSSGQNKLSLLTFHFCSCHQRSASQVWLKILESFWHLGSLAPITLQSPIPVTPLPETFAPITGTQMTIPLRFI